MCENREPVPFEYRYELTTLGACCGEDVYYYNSLDDLALEEDGFHNHSGSVIMQVKEDCGHWDNKVRWKLHHIEFYEIRDYLDEWGVDTLDSDDFIVYTDDSSPSMLVIFEYIKKCTTIVHSESKG